MILFDTNVLYDLLEIYKPVLSPEVLQSIKSEQRVAISSLSVLEAIAHISKNINDSNENSESWKRKLQLICDLRNDEHITILPFPNTIGDGQITSEGISQMLANLENSMSKGIISAFASDRKAFSEQRKRIEGLFITMYLQILSLIVTKLLIEESGSSFEDQVSKALCEYLDLNLPSLLTKNQDTLFGDDGFVKENMYNEALKDQYEYSLKTIKELDKSYQETATERVFNSATDIWTAVSRRFQRAETQTLAQDIINDFLSNNQWGYSQLGQDYLRLKLEKWAGINSDIAKLRKNDTFDIGIMGSANEHRKLLTRDKSMLAHLRNQPNCNAESLYDQHAMKLNEPQLSTYV